MIRNSHLRFVAGMLLLFGASLRFWGWALDASPFWGDEASWADRLLVQGDFFKHRPFGYVILIKALASVFGASEIVLRAPSFFASVAASTLIVWATHRITQSYAAAVFVALITLLSPDITFLALEFKPYTLEFAVHAMLLALAVVAFSNRDSAKTAELTLLWLIPLVLSLAYNVIFMAVLIYALLFRKTRGETGNARTGLWVSAGASGLCICFALWKIFSQPTAQHMFSPAYWGEKYDVFLVENSGLGYRTWLFGKVLELLRWPLEIPVVGPGPFQYLPFLGPILFGTGVFILLRRRQFAPLVIFLGPIVGMVLANMVGKWPMGPFRTNLFVFTYLLPVMALPFAAVRPARRTWSAAILGLLMAIGIPHLSSRKPFWASDPPYDAVLHAISQTRLLFSDQKSVVAYGETWSEVALLKYYGSVQPSTSIPQITFGKVYNCGNEPGCLRALNSAGLPSIVLYKGPAPDEVQWHSQRIPRTDYWYWYRI